MKMVVLGLLGGCGNLMDRVAVGLLAHSAGLKLRSVKKRGLLFLRYPFAVWWNIIVIYILYTKADAKCQCVHRHVSTLDAFARLQLAPQSTMSSVPSPPLALTHS